MNVKDKWNRINLDVKFAIILTLFLVILLSSFGAAVYLNRKSNLIEQTNERIMGHTNDLYSMLELNHRSKLEFVNVALPLAEEIFYKSGELYWDTNYVTVTATNQLTNVTKDVALYPLTLNGFPLWNNFSIVDEIEQKSQISATIFQRIDGGFIRISTTVRNARGERAVGTYIPEGSEVIETINNGETYIGRAFVVNDYYITAYTPIYVDGQIEGILYVGLPEKDLLFLEEKFLETSYYENGYPIMIDGKGELVIHPYEKGNNISGTRVFNSINTIRNGFLSYQWPETESDAQKRRIYFRYFEPYDAFVAATIDEDEVFNRPLAFLRNLILLAIATGIFLLSVGLKVLMKIITIPIDQVRVLLEKLSQGIQVKSYQTQRKDEIGKIAESLNKLIEGLKNTAAFANEIEKKNFDHPFTPLSKQDVLGNALLDMRESLIKAELEGEKRHEEEKKRTWGTEGLAKFSDILRQNNDDLDSLSFDIIKNLVQYLKVNQGGLFILNDDNQDNKTLELTACYAYDRQKFLTKSIEIGEGITGTCFLEKETTYLKDIPQDYISITSGLGDASPNFLLVVPLKLNEEVYGVVELASFDEFKSHEIEFIEKIAESIASTLSGVKTNMRTAQLLEQSQQQAEEMRAQEEEMRQNMEEMHATQEEMSRKENQLNGLFSSINDSYLFAEFDTDGKVLNVNKNFLNLFGMTSEDMIGHKHAEFDTLSQDKDAYEKFWKDLQNGKIIRKDSETVFPDRVIWLSETYSPVKDKNGKISKVILLAKDITQAKLQSDELLAQSEEMKSQQEELKQNLEEMQSQEEELKQTVEAVERGNEETAKLKEHLNSIINGMPGIIYQCHTDEHLTMNFISPYCEKITGYQPEDFTKYQNVSLAKLINPNDIEKVNKTIKDAIAKKQKFYMEYRLKDKKGKYHKVGEHGSFILDQSGKILHLQGIIFELSDLKK